MKCSFALAQINPTVGDIAGNAQRIRRARRSAPSGALLCLPELALTGYPPGDMLLNATFLDAVESAAQALAAEEGPPTLLATPWRRSGCLHNAALLLENGRVSGLVYKQVLPNYGVFDEKRWFAPSGPQAPLPWCGGRLGVLLCEDTWAPEPTAALAEQGANLLVSLNASPFEGPDKHARRLATARARVAEVGLPLAYVNCVGGQDNLVFDGGSFALDAGGAIVLQAPFFEEGTYISTSHPLQEGSDLVYRALVLATRDYARKNGFARALLGLSGGVDSALVAAVAADALGPEAVTALILPSRFTSDRSLNDARSLADFLNVKYKEISIETLLKAMEEILGLNAGLAHENLQARIRGTLLMARANETGALLLATGNKSELAVGYCTLYGDMCGGFAPLGDVYKTRVWALARHRGLPEAVITRPPTAELRENQADTDTLPPYDVLDRTLEALVERDAAPAGEEAARVWRMLCAAEHKRRQAPPAPKVTSRALRDDRRWPITAGSGGSQTTT